MAEQHGEEVLLPGSPENSPANVLDEDSTVEDVRFSPPVLSF